jgi:hypothetical protein
MEVKVDSIIANYFASDDNIGYLSYMKLGEIIDDIQQKSNYAIIIKCDNDILNSFASWYNVFKLKPTYIELDSHNAPYIQSFIKGLQENCNKILPKYVLDIFETIF